MKIGLIGSDPAGDALAAHLAGTNATVDSVVADDIAECTWVVVLPGSDEDELDAINDAMCNEAGRVFVVEAGGIGGRPIEGVSLTATALSGDGPCLDCLRHRVAGLADDAESTNATSASSSHHRLMGTIVGHALAETSSANSDELVGRIWEVPYTERRVFPIPGCERCDRNATARWDAPPAIDDPDPRGLEASLARAEQAVDPRVGLIGTVGEVASYPAPYYLAQVSDTSSFSDVKAPRQAAGVGSDWDVAFMKALGEALERYSAGVYREEWLVEGTVNDVANAIPLDRFVRPDGWEPIGDAPIQWLPGEDIGSGRECHLPAEVCLFPPASRRIRPAITTGLGLGNSRPEAILSGLLEVIERDAMMLAWYSTFEPLRVQIEDDTYQTLVSRAQGDGLGVTPILLTQDIDVPVIAVAVHREETWPQFALGSAANPDPTAAARSALCEAIQNWLELRDLGRDGAAQAGGWIGEYADFPASAKALIDPPGRIDGEHLRVELEPTPTAILAHVVAALRDAGLSAYVASLTPRDVRMLGFEAVRVVVPEAQPLFTNEAYFGDRLETVPAKLGFQSRPDRAPHPFP